MLLLSFDIDKTLTGDDEGLELLNEAICALRKIRPFKLIYNTGRGFVEYTNLRSATSKEHFRNLLVPDYLICACGSEIYQIEDGDYHLDQTYERNITKAYSKPKIVQIMAEYDEIVCQKLYEASKDDRHRHTITLHKHSIENPNELISEVRRKLRSEGIRAELVKETNVEWIDGCTYIDVLPHGCSKAGALAYLVDTIERKKNNPVVWAGDSRNDKSMLSTPYLGIIVGNAQDVLKDNANKTLHYISTEKYARGVLEGLRYFKIIKDTPKGWSLGQRLGLGVALSVGVLALMLKI